MSSHQNSRLTFSQAPYKDKDFMTNIDQEIKMGELRLRYVQLMRHAHSSLGTKAANILIKESEAIWAKLYNPNNVEKSNDI